MEDLFIELLGPLLMYGIVLPGTFARWLIFSGRKKSFDEYWKTERKKRDILIGLLIIASTIFLIVRITP